MKRLFKNSFAVLIIISFSMFLSSCAANRAISIPVPTGLLNKSSITKPIVENAIIVTVHENPQIQPVYKLEESIQAALKSTLNYSNVFGQDSSKPFKLVVNVLSWHQPSADYGMFVSTMKTHYTLSNENGNIIFEKEIITEACSDRWFFAGSKRSSRAATVNVAKNVNQFVDILKNNLEKKINSTIKKETPNPNKHQILNRKNKNTNKLSLSEELKNLSELHSSGNLTDVEFQKAKEKLLNER